MIPGDITDSRLVPFVISTEKRATDGHTLRAAGWDLEEYRAHPAILWHHGLNRDIPKVGDSAVWVAEREKVLRAVAAFFPREVNAFSYELGEMAARTGYRASVGFEILQATRAPAAVLKDKPWALDASRQRLEEWSLVNLGADSGALAEARAEGRSSAIAAELARMLDEGHREGALELVWREAFGRPRTQVDLGARAVDASMFLQGTAEEVARAIHPDQAAGIHASIYAFGELPELSPMLAGGARVELALSGDGEALARALRAPGDEDEPAPEAEDEPAPEAEDEPAPEAEDEPAPEAEDEPERMEEEDPEKRFQAILAASTRGIVPQNPTRDRLDSALNRRT